MESTRSDTRVPGEVRVRSNVVLESADQSARSLIPGDLLGEIDPTHFSRPVERRGRQYDEYMYQRPCSLCARKIHEIARDGCERDVCGTDPASVERVRKWEAAGLEAIDAERKRLAAGERDTIILRGQLDEPRTRVLDPDQAVNDLIPPATGRNDGVSVGSGDADVIQRAKTALIRGAKIDSMVDGYAASPEDNLVGTLTLSQARRSLAMIGAGDGSELEARGGSRPKFCAAYSSAALAVNSFAVWLDAPSWTGIGPFSGFIDLRFEEKLPTGLAGKPPNVDVFLEGESLSVAVESKCLEYLTPKPANFQESYGPLVKEIADPSWISMFESLKECPERFSNLDAGQLVRHYLGIKSRQRQDPQPISLAYVYWEPANQAAPSVAHRKDLDDFAQDVSDPDVPFLAISYTELWETWSKPGGPPVIRNHVAQLRDRYLVPLAD